MKQLNILAAAVMLAVPVMADTFGSGDNQFTIDFVTISGDASSANGTNISPVEPGESWYRAFTDTGYEYRIGTLEITADQWNKFVSEHGKPNGNPSSAYDADPYWTGDNIPTNNASWYEAAQFVNWLNTFHGHQPAYKFTGTQGTSNYTLGVWDASDAWGGTNLFRHKDSFYFLPTEDEWVKAAYWNGTSLQTWATKPSDTLHQGNGISGTGWNYYDDEYATDPYGLWDVGSGSQELNGTFDMMGNVVEWMENSFFESDNYASDSIHGVRGGSWFSVDGALRSDYRNYHHPDPGFENIDIGFRVASIPEPCTLLLLGVGGVLIRRKC